MRDAAKAKAELAAMSDAVKSESAAEVAGATKAAEARQADITAIKSESQELSRLADSAKATNVQLLYGGRNDMQQHLSDLDRELNYQTLLNRQEWLGFSTVQQAMAYRQQMLQQRLLENRAEFAGYLTADQYLSYMTKRTMAASLETAAVRARASAVSEEAQAMLAYDNAVAGTHATVGQLGEGTSAYAAALTGTPPLVITKAEFDDAGALDAIAAYQAVLAGIPGSETTISSSVSSPLPVPADPVPTGADLAAIEALGEALDELAVRESALESSAGTASFKPGEGDEAAWQALVDRVGAAYDAMEAADAEAKRTAGDFAPNPADAAAWEQLTLGAGSFSQAVSEAAAAPGWDQLALDVEYFSGKVEAIPGRVTSTAAFDDAAAEKELAAWLDDLEAGRQVRYVVEESVGVKLPAGGGGAAGGGGGGGPPAAASMGDDAAAARALAAAMDDLRSAEKGAAAGSVLTAAALKTTAAGERDAGGAIPPMVDGLIASTGGWFGLNSQLRVFGGLMPGVLGHVAAWHVLMDFIIEGLAIAIPAIVTLAADLTAFGLAGSDAAKQVYNRIVAIHTASDALQQTLAPMTGQLEKLHDVVRPQVWELYGDAIDIAHAKTGLFNQMAIATGGVLDRLAAHVTVFAVSASKGLATFFSVGNQDLAKLGQFFDNLGRALLALIKVTQETHVDQFFLDFFLALSQLLLLITKLPTPLLAAAVGLHAFWLWGGLAATVIMQILGPLRSLALALGAVDAAEVGGGLAGLGKDASAFERLKAGLTDIGAGLGAIPGRLNIFSRAADDAGVAAEGAAAGAAATGEEAAVAAGRTGMFSGALASLASIPVVGWLVALGVALVGVGVYLGLRTNQTQAWIESMDTALAKVTAFRVVGQTMSDLAAVTAQLAASQRSGAGDSTELANAQADLSTKLGIELDHVGQVSHAYGVSMVGALSLLNAAGVKTSDIFTANNKVWAQALQQVKGLVDGYAAMGQGMSTIQRDVSVQLVLGSDQYKAMQTLNTAWDNFQKLVAAPYTAIIQTAQGLNQFATDAKAAGAAMTGLNGPSLTLQYDFQQSYAGVETLFSSLRSAEAVTGDGGFSGAVKNAVQVLIPLAGNNKAAAAEISQLAQEAGGPATTSLALLSKWAGNTHDPLAALYKDAQNATIGASNLDQDASRLSATLANDLNPAMANAAFNALGGQQVFNTFATDLEKFGPKAQPTIQAGRAVAQELLSVDKNSASAKAQFVGWGESMGLTGAQASALWGVVSKGEKPLGSLRDALAGAAGELPKLAAPGVWGQIEHQFMSLGDKIRAHPIAFAVAGAFNFIPGVTAGLDTATSAISGFFTKTIPHAAGAMVAWFTQSLPHAWDLIYQGFFRGFASPLVNWFTVSLPHAWGLVSGALSTGWGTAWNGFNRDFAGKVVNWFTVSLPHAWGLVSGAVSGSWSNAYTGFQRNLAGPITHWATVLLPKSMGGQAISGAWGTAWNGFNRDFAGKVENWFASSLPHAVSLIGGYFSVAWGTVWNGFNRDVISKIGAWFSQSVPHALALAGSAFASTWSTVWTNFSRSVLSPLSGFFTKTVPGWLGGTGASWSSLWNTAWAHFASAIWTPFLGFFTKTVAGWFSGVGRLWNSLWSTAWSKFVSSLWNPFAGFVTRSVPNWFDGIGRSWNSLWSTAWSNFSRDLLTPMEKWFTSSLPNAIEGAFRNSVNWVVSNVINKVINGINDVTGVFGVPKIADVPTMAAGGGVRQAGGSVGGIPDVDGSHIIAMGGEWVLRQPARMALQAAYGPDFLPSLNQADSWLGAGSRGSPASQGSPAAAGGGVRSFAAGGFNPVGIAESALHAAESGVDWVKKIASEGLVAAFNGLWDSSIGKLAGLVPAGTAEGSFARLGSDDIKKGVDSFLGKAAAQAAANAKLTGGSGVVGGLPANWREIASFLSTHGFTEFAAAGVAGNIDAESGGNPEILEEGGGGGGGLIQWTPYPRSYITGNAGADLMTQLNAILSWGGGPGVVNQATSPSNAALIYQDIYERPASDTASLGVREGSANAVYRAMGWGSIGSSRLHAAAGGEVPVPYLAGFRTGTAHNILAAAQLKPTADPGQKASWWSSGSAPRATTHVPSRSAVHIDGTASTRPEGIRVPDLAGYAAGVAHNILVAAGMVPTAVSGQKASWLATGSLPGGGTGAHEGERVQILAPAPVTPGPKTPGGMDAAQAWTYYSGLLQPAAVAQRTAFGNLHAGKLPAAATTAQKAAWAKDLVTMSAQQLLSMKDEDVILSGQGSPADLTAAEWGTASSAMGRMKELEYGSINPSGNWPGWHYEYPLWKAANASTATAQGSLAQAYTAWKALYGPGAPLSTGVIYGGGSPGIRVQPAGGPGTPGIPVDLQSLINGGPDNPVVPTGPSLSATGSGFSFGGPVGGDGASLGQVAGMFALGGLVPQAPVAPVLPPGLASQLVAATGAQGMPRTTAGGGGGDRIGVSVGNLTIQNPLPEKPSDSITRSSNRLAFLAGRGPV